MSSPTLVRVALGALLAAAACSKGNASPEPGSSAAPSASVWKPRAPEVRVEVAELTQSDESIVLELPGEVEAARDALLAASLGGYVERVLAKVGDRVKKGQALAWVDSATHSARSRQAKVEVDAAHRELERAKALGGAIPKAELEAAETRYKAAKATLSAARVASSRSVIKAPFAGTVVEVEAEVGEVAAPGTPLIRVVQLDPVHVTVSVSDRDVVALSEGMPASVSIKARGQPVGGTVKRIKRAADLQTRAFEAEIEVDNDKREFLPGMIASVRLEPKSQGQHIVISQDWLITRGKNVGVFRVEKDTAHWQPVELGPVMRDRVIVDKGLRAGQTIVITGHRELVDRDRLLISRRGKCCKNGRVEFE
jgi:membrane fusion protein (multidrug efflux system)